MSRFQVGALVVYGNLGVHAVEGVGLRRFGDEPAREYYTLRPYFSDSHDRSYIPTGKDDALRPVVSAQQAAAALERIKGEELPVPLGAQAALAEHYQALLHTNDFYQYLRLFKELGQNGFFAVLKSERHGGKINLRVLLEDGITAVTINKGIAQILIEDYTYLLLSAFATLWTSMSVYTTSNLRFPMISAYRANPPSVFSAFG